jgi:hypothetical protein
MMIGGFIEFSLPLEYIFDGKYSAIPNSESYFVVVKSNWLHYSLEGGLNFGRFTWNSGRFKHYENG